MVLLKILFIVVIFLSQMYILRFHSSDEAKDERGKEIKYKTNNMLFNFLYLGVILLIVLHLLEMVSTQYLPDILLYFTLFLSVFGSVFLYINKNKPNY
ncbi:putative ATPase [Bacillus sp. TS-2]|nr:putative ATPase [Bacillus sp. TS-2]